VAGYIYSLGLLLLASAARGAGVDVGYCVLRENQDVDAFLAPEMSGVGVICLSPTSPQVNLVRVVAEAAKSISEDVKVVVGGTHASSRTSELLGFECVDAVVVGPGETPLAHYCRAISRGEIPAKCEGLLTVPGTGPGTEHCRPSLLPSTSLSAALDLLPDLDFEPYTMCSWGCRYSCRFCAEGSRFKGYGLRSPDAVERELDQIGDRFSSRKVHLADSCFPLENPLYLDLLRESRVDSFEANLRVDDLHNKTLLTRAVESGLVSICVGIESMDDTVQKSMKKSLSSTDLVAGLKLARECGIQTIKTYWLFGFPGDSIPGILKSLQEMWWLLDEGLIDDVYSKCFVPYPGTVSDQELSEAGIQINSNGWDNYYRRTFPPVCTSNSLTGIELYSAWLLSEAIRTAAIARKKDALAELSDWSMGLQKGLGQ